MYLKLSINNGVPIEFNGGPYVEANYWYGNNGEIVGGTDVDVTPLFYGVGNANGFIDLDIREITISMDTPVLEPGVEGNITGTHSGGSADWSVDVYYRTSSPEGSWGIFEEGVVCDGSGNWTATGTIAAADTYDFKAVDSVNSSAYDQVDDVVVESGVEATLAMNATAEASTPESIENTVETQSMNATCSASTPIPV